MSRKLDLVGQKFGKLTCLEFVGVSKNRTSIYKFLCECGNIVEKLGCNVESGNTKSCGCYQRINLIGQKFNRLTCLEFIGSDKRNRSIFNFICECGNKIQTLGSGVKSGNTKSCGCLKLEKASITGILNCKPVNKGWSYGTMHMRSGYEIFYAHYLDENLIDWEYEPETFKLAEGMRYTPDFYLIELDLWIEIKGKMTDKNRQKISLFRTQTGNKLKVYFLKDLEKLAGESYQNFMKENKEYYL